MNRMALTLSFIIVSTSSALAQSKWERVERLRHGSTLDVITTETTKTCAFDGADDRSMTCNGEVFLRTDVQRISLTTTRQGGALWGARVGGLVGAGVGASVGAGAGWRGAVALGALGLPVGALTGAFAGRLFGPQDRIIYVHP